MNFVVMRNYLILLNAHKFDSFAKFHILTNFEKVGSHQIFFLLGFFWSRYKVLIYLAKTLDNTLQKYVYVFLKDSLVVSIICYSIYHIISTSGRTWQRIRETRDIWDKCYTCGLSYYILVQKGVKSNQLQFNFYKKNVL